MKEVKVKEVETVKVNVPKFGTILTARPKGMSFQEYRHKLDMQRSKLKARKQFGFMCYKAIEVFEHEVGGAKVQQVKKYPPCVGKRFILNYV
jgi:hypothetical protein